MEESINTLEKLIVDIKKSLRIVEDKASEVDNRIARLERMMNYEPFYPYPPYCKFVGMYAKEIEKEWREITVRRMWMEPQGKFVKIKEELEMEYRQKIKNE